MIVREAAKVRNRLTTWYVSSDTTPGVEYTIHNKRDVVSHRKIWSCSCPDFTNRRLFNRENCKHIHEVQKFLTDQAATQLQQTWSPTVPDDVKSIISTLMAGFNSAVGLTLWSLVSFLRGPDTRFSGALKQKTTAVLRAKLGMVNGMVDTNFSDEPFGIELLRKYAADDFSYRFTFQSELRNALVAEFGRQGAVPEVVTEHFANHYAEALIAAYKLGYIK